MARDAVVTDLTPRTARESGMSIRQFSVECRTMIGEALEIAIIVSMAVLVGYPGGMMAIEAARKRRRRVRITRPSKGR